MSDARYTVCSAYFKHCRKTYFNVLGRDKQACQVKLMLMGFSAECVCDDFIFEDLLVSKQVYDLLS